MNAYLNYMIEANVGLLIFLGCYKVLLNRETNFRMLRTFLLTAIFASLAFPLIDIQSNQSISLLSIDGVLASYWLPEVVIGGTAAGKTSFDFMTYGVLIYFGGVMFFLSIVTLQLTQIVRITRNITTYRMGRFNIAESPENKSSFSFFHFIFIGQADQLTETEKTQVIQHEMVHARQWHSFDIILIQVLKIFFWFNPFISTYKKILVQLHEFEADARAVERGDVDKYCSLLARVALQSADVTLANHFSNSLTVKRITMIRTIKNKISRWKLTAFAVMIPGMFVFLACQDQLNTAQRTSDSKIFTVADEPATPAGGIDAYLNMVKRNLRYPAESRRGHMYGKVLVQFTVNEDGSLSDIELLQTPDQSLGDEAIRVLKLGSKWIPAKNSGISVKQRMIMPIMFKLDFPGMGKQEIKEFKNAENALPEIMVIGYSN